MFCNKCGYDPCECSKWYKPPRCGETEAKTLMRHEGMFRNLDCTVADFQKQAEKVLCEVVETARATGVYYRDCEVTVSEGYSTDESAKFHIIKIPRKDSRGKHITIEQSLAYNDTTNSKVVEDTFVKSRHLMADKIWTGTSVTSEGWKGLATFKGAPIPSGNENYPSYGFTCGNTLKYYPAGSTRDMMEQDRIVNSMGCHGAIIRGGSIVNADEVHADGAYNTQTARIVIGETLGKKDRYILITGNYDQAGMTLGECAKILAGYEVDLAVAISSGNNSVALDKGKNLAVNDGVTVPSLSSFFYISKRKSFKNDFQYEIARLVQDYARLLSKDFINGEQIADLFAKLQELADKLTEEINRIENIISELDGDLRRLIKEEEEARIAGDEALAKRITNEIADINTRIDEETARLDSKIDEVREDLEKLNQLLDDYIRDITERLQEIFNKISELDAKDADLQDQINAVSSDLQNFILTANGKFAQITEDINGLKERLLTVESRLNNLNELITQLQNQFTALDTALTEALKTISQWEEAINNLKESNANILSSIDDLTTRVTQLETDVNTLRNTVTNLQSTVLSLFNVVQPTDSYWSGGNNLVVRMKNHDSVLNVIDESVNDLEEFVKPDDEFWNGEDLPTVIENIGGGEPPDLTRLNEIVEPDDALWVNNTLPPILNTLENGLNSIDNRVRPAHNIWSSFSNLPVFMQGVLDYMNLVERATNSENNASWWSENGPADTQFQLINQKLIPTDAVFTTSTLPEYINAFLSNYTTLLDVKSRAESNTDRIEVLENAENSQAVIVAIPVGNYTYPSGITSQQTVIDLKTIPEYQNMISNGYAFADFVSASHSFNGSREVFPFYWNINQTIRLFTLKVSSTNQNLFMLKNGMYSSGTDDSSATFANIIVYIRFTK